jgi:thioredoxin reductase (NADPH)
LIVGAGPAGMTAALYAGRSKHKTRVIEKHSVGGQMLLTELIENFPGALRMNSFDWVDVLKKQVAELTDVEVTEESVVEKIEGEAGHFRLRVKSQTTGRSETLEAKTVILAMGAVPKRLGLKGEKELTGRGVSYCATCDGPLYRGKDVVVIGGGDTALEEALFLRKFAGKVTLVHRRDAFRAAAVLQEKIKADPKISLKLGFVPLEIVGSNKVEGLSVQPVQGGPLETIACDGVFIFVGFIPDTGFLQGLLSLNEDGSIKTDEKMVTSLPGVFAAGDCRLRPFYQVVTACSDGAIAAYAAGKFLEKMTAA